MKMKEKHYQELHSKFLMADRQGHIDKEMQLLRASEKGSDRNKLLRWNILYQCVSSQYVVDNLYPYLDDTHIDTALRAIMKSIGKSDAFSDE